MNTYQKNGYQVTIELVQDAVLNPRDDDNLGTLACFHRRYSLGDNHGLTMEEVQAITRKKDVISVPVYMYDHSGISIKASFGNPFSCQWDSGRLGSIYVTKEKAREWLGIKRITKKQGERIIQYLMDEVEVYSNYVNGDIYTAKVEKDGETEWAGEYYGDDFETNGLNDAINDLTV